MWKRQTKVSGELGADIRIVFPRAGLKVVFDECDGFDQDETGGRLVGTYKEHGGKLTVHVTGVIEAGPQAKRTPVSFFQDGEYQEGIFRQIEDRHPETEHLGTWHTHHVNGLNTLSGGDIDTYHRTVNHRNQNTPFFYALLVTAKHRTSDPLRRYSVKHFVFRRGDKDFYEIPARHVELVDTPLVWPAKEVGSTHTSRSYSTTPPTGPNRAPDSEMIRECYPDIQPFSSPKLGVYWRGPLELLDDSRIQIVVLEDSASHPSRYSVTLRNAPDELQKVADQLAASEFSSARSALVTTERFCNRALYRLAHSRQSRVSE